MLFLKLLSLIVYTGIVCTALMLGLFLLTHRKNPPTTSLLVLGFVLFFFGLGGITLLMFTRSTP